MDSLKWQIFLSGFVDPSCVFHVSKDILAQCHWSGQGQIDWSMTIIEPAVNSLRQLQVGGLKSGEVGGQSLVSVSHMITSSGN